MKIGYLGPGKSTFGFEAAVKFFTGKEDIEFVPLLNHTEICRATGEEEVDYGVVAIENVIEGLVTETIYVLDKISRSCRVLVFGEVEIPIELFLFRKINDGSAPTKILGQIVAQKQCSEKIAIFQKDNNNICIETVASNSKAAELASKDSSCVAISTAKAEEEYGLIRLEQNSIANNPKNFTRFWIIGTKKAKPSDRDKTCLLVNLDQPIPGGISKALAPFASKKINLLLIAPIPIPGKKWEYTFMMEFAGSFSNPDMKMAYEELHASGVTMDAPLVLGSYPAGTSK